MWKINGCETILKSGIKCTATLSWVDAIVVEVIQTPVCSHLNFFLPVQHPLGSRQQCSTHSCKVQCGWTESGCVVVDMLLCEGSSMSGKKITD